MAAISLCPTLLFSNFYLAVEPVYEGRLLELALIQAQTDDLLLCSLRSIALTLRHFWKLTRLRSGLFTGADSLLLWISRYYRAVTFALSSFKCFGTVWDDISQTTLVRHKSWARLPSVVVGAFSFFCGLYLAWASFRRTILDFFPRCSLLLQPSLFLAPPSRTKLEILLIFISSEKTPGSLRHLSSATWVCVWLSWFVQVMTFHNNLLALFYTSLTSGMASSQVFPYTSILLNFCAWDRSSKHCSFIILPNLLTKQNWRLHSSFLGLFSSQVIFALPSVEWLSFPRLLSGQVNRFYSGRLHVIYCRWPINSCLSQLVLAGGLLGGHTGSQIGI